MVAADDGRDDAAIAAAIAELGRDGPPRADDLLRARATFQDFRRRRRAAVIRGGAMAGVAMAALAVLALVRFVPELGEQLGVENDHTQAEHAIDPSGQGGDAAVREEQRVRPRPQPLAVPAPAPEPEPKVEIVEDAPPAVESAPPRKSAKAVAHGTAGEMLAHARALAQEKKLAAAASAYEALVQAHPGSAEARAAAVSLGRVQLSRGRAKAALSAFDRYLAGGTGTLAEEAHWGRIQALHALGRESQRDAATKAFASAFPGSMYLPKAKALAGG
jgi:hypothetical protein